MTFVRVVVTVVYMYCTKPTQAVAERTELSTSAAVVHICHKLIISQVIGIEFPGLTLSFYDASH